METGGTRKDIGFAGLVSAHRDPHRLYDAAREAGGMHRDASAKGWIVTAHAGIKQILGDARFGSDPRLGESRMNSSGPSSFVQAAMHKQVIFTDGERHRAVQRLLLRIAASKSEVVADTVRRIARQRLQAAKARGEIDLVQDFAAPLALEAIAAVVGVPLQDPRRVEELTRWSTTYANLTSGYLLVRTKEIVQLGETFRRLVSERRAAPTDDLISALVREHVFDDEDDLVINSMAVFAAGRVTTQKLLGDGIPMLLSEWGRWRNALRGDAAFARRLTEELLRLVTPTRYLARYASQDLELPAGDLGTNRVCKGERAILFLEAANRDPDVFPDPHRFEPARQPNAHVAFGFGPHRCPGASVARVEIQIALEELLQAFDQVRPHPSAQPTYEANPNLGGFASYPCVCR